MTHPTDEELDALIAAINYSTRDPETGDDLFPGSYVHLSVEDAIAAAIAIISLRHHNVEARHLMHMRHQEMLTADGLMRKHKARADRAEAEGRSLKAAIFGSENYAHDLKCGNFVEMAKALHVAQKDFATSQAGGAE